MKKVIIATLVFLVGCKENQTPINKNVRLLPSHITNIQFGKGTFQWNDVSKMLTLFEDSTVYQASINNIRAEIKDSVMFVEIIQEHAVINNVFISK